MVLLAVEVVRPFEAFIVLGALETIMPPLPLEALRALGAIEAIEATELLVEVDREVEAMPCEVAGSLSLSVTKANCQRECERLGVDLPTKKLSSQRDARL